MAKSAFQGPFRGKGPTPRPSRPTRTPRVGNSRGNSQMPGAPTPAKATISSPIRTPKVRVTSKAGRPGRLPTVPKVRPPQ